MVLLVGVCIEELELFEVFLAGFSLNGGGFIAASLNRYRYKY
ncbi:putative membrane protein [Helicobacter pylori NQ4099]|uniref:Putative membrane protein n=1 Tax=Helicobacter pylori NQ4099 TaxID=992026 RepID=I9Q5D7_HELPX|nr:putative membrane protein [Helicobacter pylori NQ4099]